jgi:hypothetical protein
MVMSKVKSKPKTVSKSRREIAKKATYVIPAVLTLAVKPSFAAAASGPPPGRKRPTS